MSWGSEFFTGKKNVFGDQKEPSERIVKVENKARLCSGCNQSIGAVSTALYQIEEKYYCSECYFRSIVNPAVERDHSDIKHEKETLNQQTT